MHREQLRFWLWAGAALLAGLLLRLWFVTHTALFTGDSLVYGEIARNWLQHGVYGLSAAGRTPGSVTIHPTLIRLPGYPLFLATCFRLFGVEHYRAVMNVQIAADLLTCWLAAALAGRLFGRRARLPVLWLAVLCPFTASYTSRVLAETLVLTTIALSFYAFARWQDEGLGYNRWLWVVAASLGYSVLLRPEQGLLAAAVLPAMLWRSLATRERRARPWRSSLPVLAAAVCIALPLLFWTARNARIFHVFQPLAPRSANDPGVPVLDGFSRWYASWAIDYASTDQVCWNMDGAPIAFSALPSRAFDAATPAATEDMRRRTAALLADYNKTLILTPALDARFAALADVLIDAHPVRYRVGLPIARVLDMSLRPRTEVLPIADDWWKWGEHRGQSAFAVFYAVLNLAYFAFALAGLYVWKRRAWVAPGVLAARCLSTSGLSAGGLSTAALSGDNAHGSGRCAYRELAFAMAASLILRAALFLFISNSEPRYTLEFFPVLLVWIGAFFVEPALAEPTFATQPLAVPPLASPSNAQR